MRLKEKFNQLKKKGKKAFIAYIPFGFPDIKSTKGICLALQEAGADIIEVGIPFSDPLADGPIIQQATTVALNKGATISMIFEAMEKLKKSLKIPVMLMSYYNPILQFGRERFFGRMKKAGIGAVTIVDLPVEESLEYKKTAEKFDIDTIFFVTPVTPSKRISKIAKASRGFIYYVSVTGITGPRDFNYSSLKKHIDILKKKTSLPVCVGFGIHTKKQVKVISSFSDGVIVGSEIVSFIAANHSKNDFLKKLKKQILSLKGDG
ncbi:MAG: tryptophan synthase subunit alpha [Candidatus Omnitrophica bacterium]|nr:tryptophan synthase subunit alpha [Candidatus Omnitrophota bacterium]MDD5429540.1 tryptophan synthase subunit alpha [Candidatus Omnitrophota bacterium]